MITFESEYEKYLYIHKAKYVENQSEEQIAFDLGIKSVNSLRARYSQLKKEFGELSSEEEQIPDAVDKVIVNISPSGEVGSRRIIEIEETELKNPDTLMEKHGFDPLEWELTNARNEYWQSQRHHDFGGGAITLYLSEIKVKPRQVSLTRESLEELFASLDPIDLPSPVLANADVDGYIVEIDLADFHLGSRDNHGEKAKQRMLNTINDIIGRIGNRRISKIVLVLLGDTIHFDTVNGTTTSGTQLSPAIGYREAFDEVTSILIEVIWTLSYVAPVEVVVVPGNHDELSEYHLCKALDYYFISTDDIIIDTEYKHRTWRRWGNVLVGWTHGNMAKSRISKWLHQEARSDFGKSRFAEIHAGDIHHEVSNEDNGVILRYVPTMAPPDEWTDKQGYMSVRRTMTFLWHPNKGLTEIWYSLP